VELERAVLQGVSGLAEAAAVGVPPPGGGPEQLHLFLVLEAAACRSGAGEALLQQKCQAAIRGQLNPLFKVGGPAPGARALRWRGLLAGCLRGRSWYGNAAHLHHSACLAAHHCGRAAPASKPKPLPAALQGLLGAHWAGRPCAAAGAERRRARCCAAG
jgi:hypothetical protein